LSQWQWTTRIGSPSYSYWMARQRQWPVVGMSMAPVRPLERSRGYPVDTFECAGEVALVSKARRGCRFGRGRALVDQVGGMAQRPVGQIRAGCQTSDALDIADHLEARNPRQRREVPQIERCRQVVLDRIGIEREPVRGTGGFHLFGIAAAIRMAQDQVAH